MFPNGVDALRNRWTAHDGSGLKAALSAQSSRRSASAMPRKLTQSQSIYICRDGPGADLALTHMFCWLLDPKQLKVSAFTSVRPCVDGSGSQRIGTGAAALCSGLPHRVNQGHASTRHVYPEIDL
jgi:hypothetical protein